MVILTDSPSASALWDAQTMFGQKGHYGNSYRVYQGALLHTHPLRE